jgi:hypothetical protein
MAATTSRWFESFAIRSATMMMVDHAYFIERTACPCCVSTDIRTIYECGFDVDPIRAYLEAFYEAQGGVEFEYLQGASFVVRQCGQCNLIFQGQIGNDFLLQKLYEEWINPSRARAIDDLRGNLDFHVAHLNEILAVLSQIGKRPSEIRILDFGMGWGRWCRMVKAFGCQVYGTELSEERIAFAQSHGIPAVSWDEIPGKAFDFINIEQVFEHIPHPLTTLKHLSSGLAQDGLVKISVPNGVRVRELLKAPDWKAPKRSARSLNAVAPLEHINCFNRAALAVLGEKAGMAPMELDWETCIDIRSRKKLWSRAHLWRRIRAPLGRLKRSVRGLLFPHDADGFETSLYFRKA